MAIRIEKGNLEFSKELEHIIEFYVKSRSRTGKYGLGPRGCNPKQTGPQAWHLYTKLV